jgi:single-stranded DNA-binding protein
MKNQTCSTIVKIENQHNVNIFSNNTLKNINTTVKTGVDVIVRGVRNILTFGRS